MPQVFVITNCLSYAQLNRMGDALIPAVERAFGIEGKNDTAVTMLNDISTINEADIQIEIRYTAGHDEYGWGRPFDPTLDEQKLLAEAIQCAVDRFLEKENGKADFSLSVWCKPYYNSHFQMWKKS